MSDWEANALAQALRDSAREHAAVLGCERAATRIAQQRALQAEAALRALPDALQRASAAEAALRTMQDKLSGELVGSDARVRAERAPKLSRARFAGWPSRPARWCWGCPLQ